MDLDLAKVGTTMMDPWDGVIIGTYTGKGRGFKSREEEELGEKFVGLGDGDGDELVGGKMEVTKWMGYLALGDEKDGKEGIIEASNLVSRIGISSICVCWVAKDFFNDSKPSECHRTVESRISTLEKMISSCRASLSVSTASRSSIVVSCSSVMSLVG